MPDTLAERRETKQEVTDHQPQPGMPRRMHMVDQHRPDRKDSIPPTMEEQRSLNKLEDTEIEMDTFIKLPPRIRDVLLVENFHTALANVRIGLTNRQHQRRKLLRPDNRMSDR